jgi:hypothetical protein
MEPGHCEQGSLLYDLFYDRSVALALAEAGARRDGLKQEHQKARCAYIEHVVSCTGCAWDTLAFAYLDTMDDSGIAHAIGALD